MSVIKDVKKKRITKKKTTNKITTNEEITNEELLKNKEYSELLKRNEKLIHNICNMYKLKSNLEYEELWSICLIAFVKSLKGFNYQNKWSTYFYTIATRDIVQQIRLNKKQSSEISLNTPLGTTLDGSELTLEDVIPSDEDLETDIVNLVYGDEIKQTINTLDWKRRYILLELYYNNKTMAEVGNALGISTQAVSTQHKIALRQLRNQLRAKKLYT